MTKNEIVGRLKDGGLDASSTNRSAAVYVADAREGRAAPGWFAYRIICDSEATERRSRAILSRWYDIEASGNVWRLRSKNRVPLMAVKRGGVPPTPPTVEYMYFEAVQANSTVSMMSSLATAPNLEYSTDGVNWQEWQHTTADGTHTFDTLTLTNVGDKVYLRGDNPNGLGIFNEGTPSPATYFSLSGKLNSGGNLVTLIDKEGTTTSLPDAAFCGLFAGQGPGYDVLLTTPNLGSSTHIGKQALAFTFANNNGLTAGPDFSNILEIDKDGLMVAFYMCSNLVIPSDFNSSAVFSGESFAGLYFSGSPELVLVQDGNFTFSFPNLPVTAGFDTFSTPQEVADYMTTSPF